jgi:hypothetical protein
MIIQTTLSERFNTKNKTMKKFILIPAIALSGLMINTANAQIGMRIGFHFPPHRGFFAPPHRPFLPLPPVVIAPRPVYEEPVAYQEPAATYEQPAPVYNQADYTDTTDDYYYLPDVDAYYNVTDQCYFYFNGDNWISAAYLPGAYYNYDWRSGRHFEVRAARPYLHDDFYRSRYNGQRVAEWSHANNNNRFDGGYANQGYRNNAPQMARGGFNQGAQPFRANVQHFDNREQGRFNQPAQPNRNTEQHFDNRSKQPSYQNHAQDTRGGAEHFVQNNRPQNNLANRRMSKF